MSLTNKVRKIIVDELKSILSEDIEVYSNDSSSENVNHVTYYLNELSIYRKRNDFSLTIYIFNKSIEKVENIADDIRNYFDYTSFVRDDSCITIYFENKNIVEDVKESIHGRMLRFSITAYERRA